MQACILHLIRNTFRYASRKYWDQIAHDLRPVYTAATEAEARPRFEEFAEKWGKPYPGDHQAVGERLDRVRAVPGLRRGDPQDHLLDQCDRVVERPLPAGRAGPRALSQRAGRAEMSLPDHPVPGPDRQR